HWSRRTLGPVPSPPSCRRDRASPRTRAFREPLPRDCKGSPDQLHLLWLRLPVGGSAVISLKPLEDVARQPGQEAVVLSSAALHGQSEILAGQIAQALSLILVLGFPYPAHHFDVH